MNKKRLLIIIVVLGIIVLTTGLITSIYTPKTKKETKKKSQEKINKNKLICSKYNEYYSITITSKLEENKVESIKILIEDNSVNEQAGLAIIEFYSSLIGSKYSSIDNKTTIELEDETKEYYTSTKTISKMFSNYEETKKYYISDGYTCK